MLNGKVNTQNLKKLSPLSSTDLRSRPDEGKLRPFERGNNNSYSYFNGVSCAM